MVRLVVNNYEQNCILENALVENGIAYELDLDETIKRPYLEVKDKTMNTGSALNWIYEHGGVNG